MNFKDYIHNIMINEGVYDPYILKAVFFAGGPGSGKSHISKAMFEGLGLKFINSDAIFERYLKQANIPLDNINLNQFPMQKALRDKAKELKDKQFDVLKEQMLGLVIDGTGHSFENIKNASDALETLGYDTYLVFVNTDLDTSIGRNMKRDRKMTDLDLIKQRWQSVQFNIGKFQQYFGAENMLIIDNNEDVPSNKMHDFELKLRRAALSLLSKPLKNPLGNEKIKMAFKNQEPNLLHPTVSPYIKSSNNSQFNQAS